MNTGYRYLPSVQTMRCFEAAARLGSFTLAANELLITQSAISRQIHAFEETVGQRLFYRSGNRLLLTLAGRTIAVETRRALDYLAHAFPAAGPGVRSSPPIVTIGAQFAIAEHWLIPRLPELQAVAGDCGLFFAALPDLDESIPDAAEFSIVYGLGEAAGPDCRKITDEVVFPVCSPQFLKDNPDLTPHTMQTKSLLLHSRVTWNLWLEKAGLPIVYPMRAVLFDDVALTVRGALAGQGIAMARSMLVRDYLKAGQLVRLFDVVVPGVFSYFLLQRSATLSEKGKSLSEWIVQQMAATSEERSFSGGR